MKIRINCLGMLVMVLLFAMAVVYCDNGSDDETGKYGADTINGVWYRADDWGRGEKSGTVITIKDGQGILTSIDNKKNSSTGNYLCAYANYVNRGLINIGDTVFRNIVYTGYEEGSKRHTWSYDIWYRDGDVISYNGDNGGTPDWRNGQQLRYHTNEHSSYPETLWAGYGRTIIISFRK